jgi:hypothetical protein
VTITDLAGNSTDRTLGTTTVGQAEETQFALGTSAASDARFALAAPCQRVTASAHRSGRVTAARLATWKRKTIKIQSFLQENQLLTRKNFEKCAGKRATMNDICQIQETLVFSFSFQTGHNDLARLCAYYV